MNKELEELVEKVKNGTANEEETLKLVETMNISMKALNALIQAIKEQKKV